MPCSKPGKALSSFCASILLIRVLVPDILWVQTASGCESFQRDIPSGIWWIKYLVDRHAHILRLEALQPRRTEGSSSAQALDGGIGRARPTIPHAPAAARRAWRTW